MVEDQTREHLNELDIFNSSGSDGMLQETNQCHCVPLSDTAERLGLLGELLEERKCVSYLQEIQQRCRMLQADQSFLAHLAKVLLGNISKYKKSDWK